MMVSRSITAAALALYLLVLVVTGLLAAKRTKSFRDYVMGGGAIPSWMLALSFMANFISSNSFVGHAAQSYRSGLIWCIAGGITVLCCAVSWHVFAPRFTAFARAHGAATLPDFFEIRFGSRRLAVLVHWVIVIATLFYVLAVLRGTALVVAAGMGISYGIALLVIYAVTLVYCIFGGLWADVSTDVVQAFILFAGAIVLFTVLWTAGAVEVAAAPPIREPPLGPVIAVGLAGGVKLLSDPKQVMVFYAFRDEASAKRFRWIGPLFLLIVYACLFPVGFLARKLISGVDDLDKLVPALVFEQNMLGSWFGALVLIALFAASMSSLDSALLVMASSLEKHVIAPLFRREPTMRSTRLVLFGVATLALALSLRPLGGIVELTTLAGALIGATLLPAICVGFTSMAIPARAVALSMGAGLAGMLAGKLAPWALGWKSPWIQDIFIGLICSSAALVPLLRRSRTRTPRSG